jgi:Na+/proline symporter
MNSFGIPEASMGGLGFIAIVYGALVFIIHIVMAFVVNNDAKQLESESKGTFLFIPFFWSLIVFVFGIAGLALYWAVHHSTLRSNSLHEDE